VDLVVTNIAAFLQSLASNASLAGSVVGFEPINEPGLGWEDLSEVIQNYTLATAKPVYQATQVPIVLNFIGGNSDGMADFVVQNQDAHNIPHHLSIDYHHCTLYLQRGVLCCAMLAMLAMLCCAMLAMLCCVRLCFALLWYALWYAVLCCAMLCCAMLCCAMLCYAAVACAHSSSVLQTTTGVVQLGTPLPGTCSPRCANVTPRL